MGDQYLQEDLCKKCVHFLAFHINIDNVYKILEFGRQKDIPQIENWCLKWFDHKRRHQTMPDLIQYCKILYSLIQYLERPESLEFKENNKKFRNVALNWVLDRFEHLYRHEKEKMEFYESWILGNIEIDTIADLAFFVVDVEKSSDDEDFEAIEIFVIRFKKAALNFVKENIKALKANRITQSFPDEFIEEYNEYINAEETNMQAQGETTADNKESSTETVEARDKKRMEPAQNDIEENHELKKTKQPDHKDGDERV